MPVLCGFRSLQRRSCVAALLLVLFVGGAGAAAWHLVSFGNVPPTAVATDESDRGQSPAHHERDCRLCSSTSSSLLPPSAAVVALRSSTPRVVLPARPAPAPQLQVFAGPLGSRAPPAPPV